VFRLISILLIINSSVFAQSKIDSLKQVVDTIQDDSLLVRTYLQLYFEYHRADQKIALEYTSKAKELSEKAGMKSSLAKAAFRKGSALRNMSLYAQAEMEFDQSISIYSLLEDTSGIVNVKTQKARLFQEQSNVEEAITLYMETLTLTQQINDKNGEAMIYNYLGTIYRNQKQHHKAIEYYSSALLLVKELNFKPGISACLSNLAIVHMEIKNYDKAITSLNEALKLKRETNDNLGACRVFINLVGVYEKMNQYDKAEFYLNEAFQLAKEVNNPLLISQIEYAFAKLAYNKGEFAECIVITNKVIASSAITKDLKVVVEAYQLLADAYEKTGDYKKAYTNFVTYKQLSDSLYNEKKLLVTNDLEAKYQNEQKAKEIALLESENELQVLQTLKRKNERNYLIVVAVVILLITGLLYNQYRIKQKANVKLKELDQLKSDFFANISHEFRTPLSLIMAPLKDKIGQSKNKREREEYDMMYRNADSLFNLINQLLDLSKLEGGSLELERAATEVSHFFNIISASFSSLAEYKKVDFESEIPGEQIFMEFDQDIIQKVCYNLLSNAFKFTRPGDEVKFSVSVGEDKLIIIVADSGSGIPIEDQDKVFDRFFQSSNEQQLGTGIGLALTKQLVQIHKGKINLESEIDKGSTITVEIPVKKTSTPEKANVIKGSITPLQDSVPSAGDKNIVNTKNEPIILVIEDNPDLRNYLAELLLENYVIHKAKDGVEGIQAAKEIVPDLIISDVMMPQKDGMEVCSELKQAKETDHIPIILLTARADQESKLQGLTHGADDYLLKPFDPKELKVRISNLLDQRAKLKKKYTKLLLLKPDEIEISTVEESFLKTALDIVNKNMDNSAFSAQQFCSEIGMSRMQLHRKLTVLTGYSTTAFVRHQRMIRASQLLEAGEPVSQVAYTVGFESPSYFTKTFKEEFGILPSEHTLKIK